MSLSKLFAGLAAMLLGGFALAAALIFTALFGAPMYAVYAAGALGIVGLLAWNLASWLNDRGKRVVKTAYVIFCLAAALYVANGMRLENLPTVDDRALTLSQYKPFTEDSKAVRLEEEPTLKLEGDISSLPSMDGATALYPVYAAFAQAVYPEGEYPLTYNSSVACTNTVGAYQKLIDGEVDIIFVAAPSQTQRDDAERAGIELHMTPIGREAFVFFVNSRNPVEGLTVEQIKGIYSGEITNWSKVGGQFRSIRAFQRAENSGSQSALQRLMGDTPLMEPEKENVIDAMNGIISMVASYKNYKNAIGYSFRYYSTEMVTNDQIRLLALDGVPPTRETIRDGSYPISNEFYAVTASPAGQPAPEESDEQLAALLDWILSPQGQWIIDETGYVSIN